MNKNRNKKRTPIKVIIFTLLWVIPFGSIGLIIWLFMIKKPIKSPAGHKKIRNDSAGQGHYHASRGSRLHDGIDLLVKQGDKIFAPYDCVITRYSLPYASDKRWKGVELVGQVKDSTFTSKIWYFEPIGLGSYKQGELIGYAQAISFKYGGDMKDHIHWLLRENGESVDPQKYI